MIELRSKILSGLFWQYLQRLSAQAIQLAISIVLARLLLPKDFGIVALIGVFISISNVIIDSGFSNALIQKKKVDQTDYSTIFFLNLLLAIILYLLLFLAAPKIAYFYKEPLLTGVIRITSISIIFSGISIIQTSVLTRDLAFQKSFIVSIVSTLMSGSIGIVLAINNFGIWSLVIYQLSGQLVNSVGYWFIVGWRPSLIFDWNRVKSLYDYGWKVLAGSIVGVLYNNVYNIVIGKKYDTTLLGFYNRGMLIPTLIVETAANSINGVMFPTLSAIQDNVVRVKSIAQKMLKVSTYIIYLLVVLMAVQAKPLIEILLTNKWLPSVPFLQIVCLTVSFYPFYLINISVLTSMGRSDLYLKMTLISKSISLALIIACVPFGIYVMVLAGAIGALISAILSSSWGNSLISYSTKEQLADVFPSFLVALITGTLVWLITLLNLSNWSTIIFGSMAGIFIYIVLSIILKIDTPKYIYKEIRLFINDRFSHKSTQF